MTRKGEMYPNFLYVTHSTLIPRLDKDGKIKETHRPISSINVKILKIMYMFVHVHAGKLNLSIWM